MSGMVKGDTQRGRPANGGLTSSGDDREQGQQDKVYGYVWGLVSDSITLTCSNNHFHS